MPRRARDEFAPPSSRGHRTPYVFAVLTSLVRRARLAPETARSLVDQWKPYIRSRMNAEKSADSTAEHIARIESLRRSSRPPPARDRGRSRQRFSHDPARLSRAERTRTAGIERISDKGIPYRTCPRGTRLQALMFPRTHYTPARARAWASKHDFTVRKLEEGPNWIRIQLSPSKLFQKGSFRNIIISERHNVRGLICCPLIEIGGRSTRRGVRPVEVPRRRITVEERRRRAA